MSATRQIDAAFVNRILMILTGVCYKRCTCTTVQPGDYAMTCLCFELFLFTQMCLLIAANMYAGLF